MLRRVHPCRLLCQRRTFGSDSSNISTVKLSKICFEDPSNTLIRDGKLIMEKLVPKMQASCQYSIPLIAHLDTSTFRLNFHLKGFNVDGERKRRYFLIGDICGGRLRGGLTETEDGYEAHLMKYESCDSNTPSSSHGSGMMKKMSKHADTMSFYNRDYDSKLEALQAASSFLYRKAFNVMKSNSHDSRSWFVNNLYRIVIPVPDPDEPNDQNDVLSKPPMLFVHISRGFSVVLDAVTWNTVQQIGGIMVDLQNDRWAIKCRQGSFRTPTFWKVDPSLDDSFVQRYDKQIVDKHSVGLRFALFNVFASDHQWLRSNLRRENMGFGIPVDWTNVSHVVHQRDKINPSYFLSHLYDKSNVAQIKVTDLTSRELFNIVGVSCKSRQFGATSKRTDSDLRILHYLPTPDQFNEILNIKSIVSYENSIAPRADEVERQEVELVRDFLAGEMQVNPPLKKLLPKFVLLRRPTDTHSLGYMIREKEADGKWVTRSFAVRNYGFGFKGALNAALWAQRILTWRSLGGTIGLRSFEKVEETRQMLDGIENECWKMED